MLSCSSGTATLSHSTPGQTVLAEIEVQATSLGAVLLAIRQNWFLVSVRIAGSESASHDFGFWVVMKTNALSVGPWGRCLGAFPA